AGLSPYVHAIFRSAGANDAFDYLKTVDDAVAFFPHLLSQEMILSNWADAVARG
ncbi:MAG: hypothetical protein JNG84_12540, partial [Archangium sp.]|nr:hypothetical protein [Archangium sp.]